jgi:hypothetical protein
LSASLLPISWPHLLKLRRRDLQRRERFILLDEELILPPTGTSSSSHKKAGNVTDRLTRCARPTERKGVVLGLGLVWYEGTKTMEG